MPSFTIEPFDGSKLVGITPTGAAGVLQLVQRLACKQADVSIDGEYSFSVRFENNGLWYIYQRDEEVPTIPPYG